MKILFIAANAVREPIQGDWPGYGNQRIQDGVAEAAEDCKQDGYRIICIENQGGAGKFKTLDEMQMEFFQFCQLAPWLDQVYVCPDWHKVTHKSRWDTVAGVFAYQFTPDPGSPVPGMRIFFNEAADIDFAATKFGNDINPAEVIKIQCRDGFRKPGVGLYCLAAINEKTQLELSPSPYPINDRIIQSSETVAVVSDDSDRGASAIGAHLITLDDWITD